MPSIELELSRHTHREGERLAQEVGEVLVGRSMACDVQLRSDLVSRMHVRLFLSEEGRWRVEDLSSRNGTFLNGRRIMKAELRPGDLVVLGQGGPELIVAAMDPAPPEAAESEEATRMIRMDPKELEEADRPPPRISRKPIPAGSESATVGVDEDEDEEPDYNTEEMPTAEALPGGGGHAFRFLLLVLVGGGLGFLLGLQFAGNSLPWKEITAPALWLAAKLAPSLDFIEAGWLLPIAMAVYGALVFAFLQLGKVGLILVVLLIGAHVGAVFLLKDTAGAKALLDATATLRDNLLGR